MFARWPEEASQALTTACALAKPEAMFSPHPAVYPQAFSRSDALRATGGAGSSWAM